MTSQCVGQCRLAYKAGSICWSRSQLAYTWCNGDANANPVNELQSLVAEPLFTNSEAPFCPNVDELKQADKVFQAGLESHSIHGSKGIDTSNLPNTSVPEVCGL